MQTCNDNPLGLEITVNDLCVLMDEGAADKSERFCLSPNFDGTAHYVSIDDFESASNVNMFVFFAVFATPSVLIFHFVFRAIQNHFHVTGQTRLSCCICIAC